MPVYSPTIICFVCWLTNTSSDPLELDPRPCLQTTSRFAPLTHCNVGYHTMGDKRNLLVFEDNFQCYRLTPMKFPTTREVKTI